MTTISIDVPNAVTTRVVDAVCAMQGYHATIPDPANPDGPYIPNPQTKAQFVKAYIAGYIKQIVIAYETQQASAQASSAAAATANTDIAIT